MTASARRPGYLLAEAVVMLVLAVLVGAIMCGALLSQVRLARSISERVARNDAARSALHIVPTELRTLDPSTDIRAAAADSIAARWVRSSGIVCAGAPPDLWVRMTGMRQPDPSKDSVIIVRAGSDRVVGIDAVAPDASACVGVGSGPVYRIRSADMAADTNAVVGGAALVFESGTYYLSQRALRYRVGAEGRQPLTDEALRDAGSAMRIDGAAGPFPATFRITLELRPGTGQTGSRTAGVVQPFVNSGRPL
ncbi:MAG TPA: hypothetical protein VF035_02560 [Longimicrobiales bacterium]